MSARRSTVRWFRCSLIVLLALGPIAAMAGGRQDREPPRLDPRITKAHAGWSEQGDREWDNPIVFVDLDGAHVRAGDAKAGDWGPRVGDVAAALVGLPVSAWPRGRVVLLSQSSRVPLAFADEPEPTDPSYLRLKAVRAALVDLGVEVIEGPVG